MFGGDEVGAMVLDVGSANTRVGFAGEDTPKAVFSTRVGEVDDEGGKKYYVARQKNAHRERMEITSPVVNGLVEDWDALEHLWDYALRSHLLVDPKDHPLMIAECNFNTADRRAKMVELAFEKFESPAVFLCQAAVLAAFSMGKASALVVDVGAGCTTTVPVHDGFMLRGGLRRTKIAGDSLDAFVEDAVFNKQQREIVPSYMFKRELGSMGKHVNKKLSLKNTTPSYEQYMKRQVAQSVKESICRISEQPFNLLQNTNIPKEKYELPDGNVIEMGSDRFAIGEHLFRPSSEFLELAGPDFEGQPQFEGLHQMVASSIDACDVDVRKELYNHILLTGASTCIVGTDKRLIADLNRNLTPAFRVKLLGAPVERRFGSWTGGSILGSLGSFHQMWVSKAEYEEKGAALLAQKCP